MTAEGNPARASVRRTTSLLINVSTLLQEPIGSLRQYEIEAASGAGLSASVSGDLRLLRTDQSLLATAELSTTVDEVCGSCLDEIVQMLEVSFDEEFWPQMDHISGRALEPPPERVGFAVIDGEIDLSEAVRQYVEMARPMSPRCGPDCPGPDMELSTEPPLDSRWSALAALQLESEGD